MCISQWSVSRNIDLDLLYPTICNISQSIVVSCISHLISPYISTFHILQSTIFLNQSYLTLIDPSSTFPLKCVSLHSSQFNVPPSLLLLYFSTVLSLNTSKLTINVQYFLTISIWQLILPIPLNFPPQTVYYYLLNNFKLTILHRLSIYYTWHAICISQITNRTSTVPLNLINCTS